MRDDGPIQVLILESDTALAGKYSRLVGCIATHRLVGIATTVDRAWEALRRRVDVVVIGTVEKPAEAALFLRRLRFANLPLDVIVISDRSDAKAVREALRLGVSDYLVTPILPERFLRSLRQVGEYSRLASAGLGQADVDQLRSLSMPAKPWLPRELSAERLAAVRRYITTAEPPLLAATVARALGMSRVTARRYLEFLVATGELDALDCANDRRGRPSKAYGPHALTVNRMLPA
jgi:two-component system response regulator DctR